MGKIDNGIVAVTAWGLIDGITFPLIFEVYKPKGRLQVGDSYRSKPEIAAQMVLELKQIGFELELVLADSLYGESESNFLGCLKELNLNFIVAIRRNHGVWLPKGQTVRCNRWHASRLNGGNPRTALARKFDRTFSDGTQQVRYVREIIFGKKRSRRFFPRLIDLMNFFPSAVPQPTSKADYLFSSA